MHVLAGFASGEERACGLLCVWVACIACEKDDEKAAQLAAEVVFVGCGLPANFGECGRGELRDAVENSLRRAALWDEVKDKLHQSGMSLSGGQQQRLCIARGIAVKPEVILLDEPASALDPISTARIEELVHELKSEYTIVIVTHNMQQAARVSDFTAYMYLGELMEFGVTDEIFIKPKRKETEDYITGRFG